MSRVLTLVSLRLLEVRINVHVGSGVAAPTWLQDHRRNRKRQSWRPLEILLRLTTSIDFLLVDVATMLPTENRTAGECLTMRVAAAAAPTACLLHCRGEGGSSGWTIGFGLSSVLCVLFLVAPCVPCRRLPGVASPAVGKRPSVGDTAVGQGPL